MSRPHVPSRSPVWPRVVILASVGLLAAGCADSARFSSDEPRPQADITGSITQPAPTNRVIAQPLPAPAPARPAIVAAPGNATGATSLEAYRPPARSADITGSVRPPGPAPAPAGHWTWDGGSAVVVGQGQTLEQIAQRSGVPLAAIMQVNGLSSASAIRPGQRLVIPRYVSANAPHVAPPPRARVSETIHIVAPGETLMSIARKHGVTLSALARANKINAFGRISIGQRLTIPGGKHVAELRAPAPKPARPGTVAPESVATLPPPENIRLAKPDAEPVAPANSAVKTAEPAGAIPSFRWPVVGRVTSGFGPRPDGTRNDGIDVAVPAGTPIKAADDGVVAYSGDELKGYGNLVLIRHANGYVSAYANASQLLVKRGDTVKRGQIIARAGQTGNAKAPQLHFEIRKGPVPVDPAKFLGGA